MNRILLLSSLILSLLASGFAEAQTTFRIRVQSPTELEHPSVSLTLPDAGGTPTPVDGATAFPAGRAVDAYVFVPATGGPALPAVLVNHGSSGPFNGNVGDLAAGRLGEIYRLWGAYLATRGYLAVVVDGFTTRGFIEDERRIPPHTVGGVQRTASDYRVGPEVWSTANCGNSYGSACVDNVTQRAYDVNHVADHLLTDEFAAALRTAGGRELSVDPARRFLMGHSDGGITTLAGIFHGHADGVGMPAIFQQGYPRPRFAGAVSFYPGCFMHGAFRDDDADDEDGDGSRRDSLYYPAAPTLILHGDADELYRTRPLESDDCEWRLRSARVNASSAPFRTGQEFFEMVVYTGPGRAAGTKRGNRAGIQHSFDLANWDDTDDAEFTIPEHAAKIHADKTTLDFFDALAGLRSEPLQSGALRRGALAYGPTFLPSLAPVLQRRADALGVVDRAAVSLHLPALLQNPYFYDTASNPDVTGATVPADFTVAYERVAPLGTALPPALAYDPATHRVQGRIDGDAAASFWIAAENPWGRSVQRVDVAADGALRAGPGYRLDTANGAHAPLAAATLEVDLSRYLGEVPVGPGVQWCGVSAAGGPVPIEPGTRLRLALAGLALPQALAVCVELDGARFVERLMIERHDVAGYPSLIRARFESRHALLRAGSPPPAQDYDDDAPKFGDGFGHDPDDGDHRIAPPSAEPALFADGFE